MTTTTTEPRVSNEAGSRPADQKRPEARRGYDFSTELAFTDTYRRFRDAHPAVREARCLQVQFPAALDAIQPDDLFAGRITPKLVGFSPDEWGDTAFGYYHLPDEIGAALESSDYAPRRRRQIEEMLSLWESENTSAKVRRAYPPKMAKYLPSDDWMGESGVAFPLYRLTGGNVDYRTLMELGIPGLRERIKRRRTDASPNGKGDGALFDAWLIALDILEDVCAHYERQARETASETPDARRRTELLEMADALAALPAQAPRSLREGIQLFWLYSLVGDIRNHGRMDVYLGDLLADDLETGALTEPEALRLLQSLWRLMADRNTRVHNRVIVGGMGRPNERTADRFALLAMEATRTVPAAEPQLSLRWYEGMNAELMDKALDVLGEGRTFPILYNDDVNVPAVQRAFGLDRQTALQYVPYGCGEYVVDHQSFGTPSGVINLLKALEVTLHDGRDPVTGRQVGLAQGRLDEFETFDDLWSAYRRQVEHFVDLMAEQEVIEYRVAGAEASFLFLSLLYDDCLERGKALLSGGIRVLGGTLETYGNTSVSDSLTAIRQIVYEEQRVTPQRLLAALDADFDGYADVRRMVESCPKYGNDDDRADSMLVDVHEHVCRYVRDQAERVGLDSYLVVIINNSANTLMGRHTSASADGRRAFTPMNNGNAPSSGNDRNGLTAFLNSILKPRAEIHAGAVQNMKFSRDLFENRRDVLEALLDTYFAEGGAQAMITVIDRDDLQRAMDHPEEYGHLFVRVGGFSARFVDLPRDVQQEILDRTIY